MNEVKVAPSILSSDFANLEKELNRIKEAGADWVHTDVMDGHFVPNITIGAPVVKSLRKVTDLFIDVHLMIENPERYIKDFATAGSDLITVHYEATKDKTVEISKLIKSFGIKAGLSIKPGTEVKEIKDYINEYDLILIMTVEPGFGGQKFMNECAKKIAEIKKYANKDIFIEVDGGINAETGKICRDLGANVLVAGNYIFSSDNIKKATDLLRA